MKTILTIVLLTVSIFGFSQAKSDCQTLLTEEIHFELNDTTSLLNFISELSKLKSCGLDEGDIEVLSSPPILGTLMIKSTATMPQNPKLTYQIIYDAYLELKNDSNYKLIKSTIIISNELGRRPADLNNWNEDKLLFEKLFLSKDEIEEIFSYLKEHNNSEHTYIELLIEFDKSKKNHESITKVLIYRDFIEANTSNLNYDELLEKSIVSQKLLLFYFTGTACVNARVMESVVFTDSLVVEKLKTDYIFASFVVDDKTSLPENQQFVSEITGKRIKTVGQKHSHLQMSKFFNNSQPYFVIIDNKGQIVRELGFNRDIQSFLEFLNLE